MSRPLACGLLAGLLGAAAGIAAIGLTQGGLFWLLLLLMAGTTLVFVTISYARNKDGLEIGPVMLVMYLLYSCSFPLGTIARGKGPAQSFHLYLLVCSVGMIGFILGYSLLGKTASRLIPRFTVTSDDLRLSGYLVLLLAVPSLWQMLRFFGGMSGFLAIGYGGRRWRMLSEANLIGSGMPWFGLGLVLLVVCEKRGMRQAAIWAALALWSLANLAVGNRAVVIGGMMVLGLAYWNRRRPTARPNPLWVWAILLLAFLAAQYVSIVRDLLPNGPLRSLQLGLGLLAKEPKYLLPWRYGEFIEPGHALQELIDRPSLWNYRLGQTYLGALAYTVPGLNKLLKSVYEPPCLWRMRTFYPGLWLEGRGFGFFAPAEGFLNFGLFGAFIHMVLLGGLSGALYAYFRANSRTADPGFAHLLYATSVPPLILSALRIDSTWLWSLTHVFLWPVLVSLVVASFRRITARKGQAAAVPGHPVTTRLGR